MTLLGKVSIALLATGMAAAQTTATSTTTTTTKTKHTTSKKPVKKSATELQLEELKAQMAAQQAQIDSLKSQLSNKDGELTTATQATATAQQTAADAAAKANDAATSAAAAQAQTTALQSTVTDLKATDQGLQETVIANQAAMHEAIDSPASLHYKGVTITPVAFFAFEGVYRQRSVNSDINTPFNSIAFPGATEGHVSELNFSGRQSRLGGLFEGNTGSLKLSGYAEMDFLGTGTSSNNNQSNSYVLRQRQIWAKAETAGGFAVTGGQMWSLVTEDGLSTNNRTEKLPNTIDSQYLVGFSWERQPSLRVQQRFGTLATGMFTGAVAVEQAQITGFNVSGGIPGTVGSASAVVPVQYFFGGIGQNGGLYNAAGNIGNGNTAGTAGITTYANNIIPDVVFKGALDYPHAHFELGGLARFFRNEYLPITAYGGTQAAPTYTYGTTLTSKTTAVASVFGSGRVTSKYVDVALQLMAGQGDGRYGSAQLADATLRADQTLEPIKNYHGMFSLETHPTSKLDVFAYYGGEYAQRTVYTTPQGDLLGYGVRQLSNVGCYALPTVAAGGGSGGSISTTGACQSPTRYIQEPMFGFVYRIYSSPKFGRLQYSATYSYLQRNLWSGSVTGSTVPNAPTGPRAADSMVHVGMRYYIP